MAQFMRKFEIQTFALMRIVVGFLFLCHGSQKLFNFLATGYQSSGAFVTYVGGAIELIGGALVMLGLFTRWAAFICSGEMAVAYWMVHGTHALLPIQNKGELAVLYCFAFLYISARGAGGWGIDNLRKGGES